MQNDKGYTLIETIVCIGLLSVIGLVVAISINKLNKKNDANHNEIVEREIKSAADVYLNGNHNLLNELYQNKTFIIISLKELKAAGLIDNNLKDSKGNILDDNIKVKVYVDDNGLISYVYPYEEP